MGTIETLQVLVDIFFDFPGELEQQLRIHGFNL